MLDHPLWFCQPQMDNIFGAATLEKKDSGFVIVRLFNSKPMIIFQFKEQQHGFNFPFQLSMKKFKGDDPYDSICIDIIVKKGDIVVVGSDGFFDNIFVDQILLTIEDTLNSEKDSIFQLPKLFCEESIRRGKNKTFISPFSQRAHQLGIAYSGGKLDDTTVIVAQIVEQQHPNQKEQL